jgi:hypothetical protein
MKKIEKKTHPKYFQMVLDGEKNFEIRLADWKCEKGDILVLREWDPKTKKYTGRVLEKKVISVVNTKDCNYWPEKDINKYGFQVIGLKNNENRNT